MCTCVGKRVASAMCASVSRTLRTSGAALKSVLLFGDLGGNLDGVVADRAEARRQREAPNACPAAR